MRKNILTGIVLLAAAFLLSSCGNANNPKSFDSRDLIGYWYNQSVVTDTCRFMEDKVSGEAGYCWGKLWNGTDDITEADVDLDWHGNGWFKWILDTKKLTEIHMMSISTAAIPEVYSVNTLNETTLVITNQADNKKTTYKRILK